MANNSLSTSPHIFSNKYFSMYQSIIENAKNRDVFDGYYEKHHILPKCMGGSNDKENIVRLTAREHFVCHVLLTKFTIGEYKHKMLATMVFMANKSKNHGGSYLNSRLYESVKKELSIVQSKRMMGVVIPRTEEHSQKIGDALRGRAREDMLGDKNPAKRDEVRAKITAAQLGVPKNYPSWNKGVPMSEETKKKLSIAKTGVPNYKKRGTKHSEETKKIMRLAKKDKPLSELQIAKNSNRRGKFIINNIMLGISKYIFPEELSKYEELGWTKGMLKKNG